MGFSRDLSLEREFEGGAHIVVRKWEIGNSRT
jgi:hypothetical protein